MKILKALSFGEGWERLSPVNEYKPAGTYEVEFNSHSDEGQNLSSGVYFYQLVVRGPETRSRQETYNGKR
ncbi:MAG: hypothetical protein U5J96_00535 [Ignavibacteriaceae bacterium]|nr:hypothetical protein [Ignavibacteriaceae bacterium]